MTSDCCNCILQAGKSGKGKSITGKGVQGRAVLHQAQTDGMDSLPSEDPAESSKGAQGGKAKGAKGAKGTKGAKDGWRWQLALRKVKRHRILRASSPPGQTKG